MLPALVTAPKRVAEHVWSTEAAIWRPDLRVAVAAGTPQARRRALESGADIVVIGRDNLADAVPVAGRFRTFIMDELSSFKTRGTNRWKAARKIAFTKSVTHVWGLTGTPAPNSLMDLWAQVYLLDKGERLGTTLTGFRNRFFVAGQQLPSGVVTKWTTRPGADAAIQNLLSDLCLSMGTEGRVHLPELTVNRVEVELPPAARRVYQSMKSELVADLEFLGGEIHSAASAASLSNKLSQINAGFMYTDDKDLRGGAYQKIHAESAKAVAEIADGTGSPLLVAYRYQAERDLLLAALGERAHTVATPDLQARWNNGEIPILVAHPASIGHGLNLQKGPGHSAVWASLTWSSEEYDQFNRRLYRQGQKNAVVIHHLIRPHTVDDGILQVLDHKRTVQQALRDHLDSPL